MSITYDGSWHTHHGQHPNCGDCGTYACDECRHGLHEWCADRDGGPCTCDHGQWIDRRGGPSKAWR